VKLRWADEALEDYDYWYNTDIATWKKVKAMIKRTQREPYRGWGRPKKLQRDYKGWWARRITDHDRLVYRVRRGHRNSFLDILQCRGHYGD
jgi:toxin YoeB